MPQPLSPDNVLCKAFTGKDSSFEEAFYIAVKTAGIFCRPTCMARKPDSENVEYFKTPQEALSYGYQPCKVCHPLPKQGEISEWGTPLLTEDLLKKMIGFSPRKSVDQILISITRIVMPLGPMLVGATEEGICLLEFLDRRKLNTQLKRIMKVHNGIPVLGTNHHIDQLDTELLEYFEGKRKKFTIPLITHGTPFQKKVWDALKAIRYGQTCSYQEQAKYIGKPSAVRAVARANGDNPIGIIVPCHRVIGKDGCLTGYGGGIWRKKYLLDFEANCSR